MKQYFHRTYLVRFFVVSTFAVISFLFFYILLAVGCSLIVVNKSFQQGENADVVIYLLSNGIHTDFVFPLKTPEKDWTRFIDISDLTPQHSMMNWISFGWGDKKFYLETPTWDDLTIDRALYALFLPSPSAIHVTVYRNISADENCIPVRITKEHYSQLIRYVESSFQTTPDGRVIRISNISYYNCDGFYEALGYFHLFNTCNTWTNEGLKQSGLKAALWTPIDKGILYHYR